VLGACLALYLLATTPQAADEFRVINCGSVELHNDPACIEALLLILHDSAKRAVNEPLGAEGTAFAWIEVPQKEQIAAISDPVTLLVSLRPKFNGYNDKLRRAQIFRGAFGSAFPYLAVVLKLNDNEFRKFVVKANAQWRGN
jgi:hypothetical protein